MESTNMTQQEKDKIKKQVESMTNKSHGIKSENDVLKDLNKKVD